MDLIVHPVGGPLADKLAPAHLEAVMTWEDRSDAVVLGPGMGDDVGSLAMAATVYKRLAAAGKPVVVDADALKAFSTMGDVPPHPGAVLTPHAGEFAILAGEPLPSDAPFSPRARSTLCPTARGSS